MSSLIQKIVVPIDFSDASEHAARYACTLARNLGSSVYLIHVLEQPVRGPVSSFEAGGAGASDPFVAALAITGLTDGFGHQVRTWDLALDRETVADSLTALAFRMLHPNARLPAA